MITFLAVALTFPTLVYGLLLGVALLYWLIAATGLIQFDFLDGLLGGDTGGESFSGEPGGITGPLMRLGLGGVPLSLSFSAVVLFAWALSYTLMVILGGGFIGALTMGMGLRVAILVVALIGAVPLAALALRPARGLFAKLQAVPQQHILGRAGIVSSPQVNATQGYVNVEDDGAGLVLQARSDTHAFQRGDRVRLVEYLPEANAYRVVPETEPDHAQDTGMRSTPPA
jgi:hypothetical protein